MFALGLSSIKNSITLLSNPSIIEKRLKNMQKNNSRKIE
jgi:hypothetical protein